MKNNYSDFYTTHDGEKIFFLTNFNYKIKPTNKPVLVFNYGLVCNKAHYEPQIEFFDEQGFPILIHDYRAHFNSSGKKNLKACTFENIANDLYGIIKKINAREVILIGHSMGVNVTLEFTKRYPNIVKSQILIAGTVFPPGGVMFDSNLFDFVTPLWKWFLESSPEVHEKIWTTAGINPIITNLVHSGGFNVKKVPLSFVERYINRIIKLGPKVFFQYFEQMQNHDIISDIEKIQTKSLVMGGDKDQVIPIHIQTFVHDKLPNSRLYIIKDGSHVPQIDFPQTVNERILHFINFCN